MRGLSPRGRGRRCLPVRHRGRIGTIPAWAGETTLYPGPDQAVVDHPRVGGGDLKLMPIRQLLWGPSPRGRGRQTRRSAGCQRIGTIPAWAGETRSAIGRKTRRWDHPRVGGGDNYVDLTAGYVQGPSPRGRGRRLATPEEAMQNRTIPAWAGETHVQCLDGDACGDHPRVGGGDQVAKELRDQASGPSPRGRGRHDQIDH